MWVGIFFKFVLFYKFFPLLTLSLSHSLTLLHSPSGGLTPTAGHARDIHAARAEAERAPEDEGFGFEGAGGCVSLSRPREQPPSSSAAIISATAPALAHAWRTAHPPLPGRRGCSQGARGPAGQGAPPVAAAEAAAASERSRASREQRPPAKVAAAVAGSAASAAAEAPRTSISGAR